MREIRKPGSEGGATEPNRSFLPLFGRHGPRLRGHDEDVTTFHWLKSSQCHPTTQSKI